MEGDNFYIYCIASNTLDINTKNILGHHGEQVFKKVYNDLAVYVSRIIVTHIDPNFENLQCHESVISELMKYYDVLPMSFSTIAKSEKDIIEMLQKYYDQFIENMKKVAGKVELGMKVFYKLNFDEEDKLDKELINKPKEYMMKRYERYCYRKKQMDEILSVIEEAHAVLSDIADMNCFTKPLKNNLIFNASYLVCKDKKEAFDKAIEEIKKKNQNYKILYSGPWPAYHFIIIMREGEESE